MTSNARPRAERSDSESASLPKQQKPKQTGPTTKRDITKLLLEQQASTMSSAFEPSLSTSRPPIGGPSLADTLPSVNFGFDELRDRMAKFTAKFDAFIEQGRKRVLEERNQFRAN
ncbi:hypothetical protein VTH06DRAFT_2775, partial [Thermothelomyces fergusii]